MTVPRLDIDVAILAGGLAKRLGPRTENTPKALIPIAGKPFLAHQLDLLRVQGICRVVLCVGHLGEKIANEIGDGTRYGIELAYSYDGPELLGTGGAVKRALPQLGRQFVILYGDSYLPVSLRPIVNTFINSSKCALMTVYRNEGEYDTSNVVMHDGEILAYDKRVRLPTMTHIDYGINLFRAAVFDGWPDNQPFDLADVLQQLAAERTLASFEVFERFYEIGSQQGLSDFESWVGQRQTKASQ
jgi:N-acetyl-alpha-D-muramate 1-phosphate uridylyltransferase